MLKTNLQLIFVTLLACVSNLQILQAQCQGGSTVSTPDQSHRVYTCPGDGMADIVDFTNTGTTDASYAYAITDTDNQILTVITDSSFDFEPAPPGLCRVFGFSYTGTITANPGDLVYTTQFSTDCWAISNNAIEVVREVAEGGTVSMPNGGTAYAACLNDGISDYVGFTNTSSSAAAYQYVITDDMGNILGLPNQNFANFADAPVGVCRVYGLSYTGNLQVAAGDNIVTESLASGCFELSSNFIEVDRNEVDGGTVSLLDGATSIEVCSGDGMSDVLAFTNTSASTADYAYAITDQNNNILGIATDSNDFSEAPTGLCRVFGFSYVGNITANVGESVYNTQFSDGCFLISSNAISVYRTKVAAGTLTGTKTHSRVVVANRASESISVIDSDTDEVLASYDMPNNGEPMYVVHNSSNNTVLVGDYNGSVVAFDGHDFSVVGTAEAGAGVFHMWLSPDNQQLWVNNEIDRTVSVINPNDLSTITTIELPADLLELGYKPHDVIVMPNNAAAFVTLLGAGQPSDYVLKYDAVTFEETARAAVGNDPHVSLTGANSYLYVASQGASELKVLSRSDLSEVTTLSIPNAHGLGMNNAGTHLYVGNIAMGGTDASYTVNTQDNTLAGEPVDAPFSAPHNYAVTGDDAKLFITHSGMTNYTVSIYDLTPTPVLTGSVITGSNPFGLVAYSYEETFESIAICAGDDVSDAFDVALMDNEGANSAWVITDAEGNILGLPPAPPFDLEGAGEGVCLIWHLSYEDGLMGAAMGNNAADLEGCYALSNPITVTRYVTDGGEVSDTDGNTELEFCVNDGADDVIVLANTSMGSADYRYVVTDDNNIIVGAPDVGVNEINVEGVPAGVCRVWGLSYTGDLTAMLGDDAAAVALSDGCFELSSNFVTVVRLDDDPACDGATILENNTNIAFNTGQSLKGADKLHLAPNPVDDYLQVTFISENRSDVATVQVFDISGQLMWQQPINGAKAVNQFELKTAGLQSGMYVLRVQSGATVKTSRFVKR